jgi:hypothetical protein
MKTKVAGSTSVMIVALALSGCSVLQPNNRELLSARAQLGAGNPTQALAELQKRDDLCGILDRAMILADMGKPNESNAEFDRALGQIKDFERRATVSATEVAAGAGSLLLNDKVLEYQGEGFEKVLIHAFKARNYLMLGKEEEARVEILNANRRQDEERKRHQDLIDAAKNDEAGQKAVNFGALSSEIDKQFAPSADILRRLDNVYQNPFATYMSAVVYELNNEFDDAFIDLKKAYQMTHHPVVAADLRRVAAKAHRQDELPALGLSAQAGVSAGGNTLVIIGNGVAPERVELKFPIPTPNGVLFAAVPITRAVPTNLSEVEVLGSNGEVLGRTHMMVDVEAMAVRNLRDHYPAILIRQAIRLAAKGGAAAAAKSQAGGGTAALAVDIFSTLFNAVTEQADLRAWYALPRSIHVARVNLPAGTQQLKLRLLDLAGQPFREVDVPVVAANPHLNLVAGRYINGQVMVSAPSKAQGALEIGSGK